MAFFDKLSDITKNLGEKASEAMETTRLNSKINQEKSSINEKYRQIGQLIYGKYVEGVPVDTDVTEICTGIDENNRIIQDTQAEINRIKAEAEARAAATAAPVPTSADGVACTNCGTRNAAGTKFCSSCGNKIEEPEVKTPEAPQERVCPACGAAAKADVKFCSECGTKID